MGMTQDAESSLRKRVLAAATFIKLTRACSWVTARIHVDLEHVGLTSSQFAVLEVLFNKGSLPAETVRSKVLMGGGESFFGEVAALEARGLVRRVEEGGHAHSEVLDLTDDTILDLTPEGQELMGEFLPEHLDKIEEEMGILSEEELAVLGDLLRKVGRGRAPARRGWGP